LMIVFHVTRDLKTAARVQQECNRSLSDQTPCKWSRGWGVTFDPSAPHARESP
jgi:hypothetical protein